jgi:hypothetical protein
LISAKTHIILEISPAEPLQLVRQDLLLLKIDKSTSSKETTMRPTILFIPLFTFAFSCPSQAQPEIEWQRTYGGEDDESLYSMTQTMEGGFALVGSTTSFDRGEGDVWVVITDEMGDSLWSRSYGRRDLEWGNSIFQTNDSGFVFAGITESEGAGDADMWLTKIDHQGDYVWSKTFGGTWKDGCESAVQTSDNGYALAGFIIDEEVWRCDMWLVKTNADGDSIWSQKYNFDWWDVAQVLIQTEDEGYLLAGYSVDDGEDYTEILIKTNEIGEIIWQKEFEHGISAIIQTSDGGFALAGNRRNNFYLLKLDSHGDSLWFKTYGGSETEDCNSFIQTQDGGYVLVGSTRSFGARSRDCWVIRVDENGDSLWSMTFGDVSGEVLNSIIQTEDRGYLLGGWTYSFGAGKSDFYLVKTGPDPCSAPSSSLIPHPSSLFLFPAFPNPFNSATTIKYGLPCPGNVTLRIYNPLGQQVGTLFEGYQSPGFHTTTLNAGDLPSGLYFIRLQAADQVLLGKVASIR